MILLRYTIGSRYTKAAPPKGCSGKEIVCRESAKLGGWVRRWDTLRMDSRVKGLFHQLSLDGVDAITAEDEDLTIDEDFGSLLRSNDVFEA